jgi:hypothetical protein
MASLPAAVSCAGRKACAGVLPVRGAWPMLIRVWCNCDLGRKQTTLPHLRMPARIAQAPLEYFLHRLPMCSLLWPRSTARKYLTPLHGFLTPEACTHDNAFAYIEGHWYAHMDWHKPTSSCGSCPGPPTNGQSIDISMYLEPIA